MKFYLAILALVVAVSNASYNAATGSVATQTSTGWGGVASRAIDSNTNSKWNSKTCTHTGKKGSSQYWEVKLRKSDKILGVVLYARLDACCQSHINGAQVWVGKHKCGTVKYRKNQPAYSVRCKSGVEGDRVRVVSGPGYLSLCEVKVVASMSTAGIILYNAARSRGARVYQTSVGSGGVASRAVDNNISSRFSSRSCTLTSKTGSSQYWEVTLPKQAKIYSVYIYNRLDCCQERINGVQVWVGKHKCGTVVYKKWTRLYEVVCNSAVGNKVRLVSGPSYLTLCEVKVNAVVSSG